jgi:hypothetical protein
MRLEYAFELRLRLGPRIHIQVTDDQKRGAVLVQGGRFEGSGLSGDILAGSGGDFPLIRHDDGGRFDSQYLLRTDDGAHILHRSAGIRHADRAVLARIIAGETVDPDAYYMRMTPRFEAPAGPYDWLNRTLFVGVGRRGPEGSVFRYWKVA